MPELPDIEVYRHGLLARVAGKTVRDVNVYAVKRMPAEAELRAALAGVTVRDIERDGKELRFVFDNGQTLTVHLMLNGEFHFGGDVDNPPGKKFALIFDSGETLLLSDPQGLASAQLNKPPSKAPDALDAAFDLEALRRQLRRAGSMPIKTALMDQDRVKGIGNKYSDEVLWAAGISPLSHSSAVPDEAVARLHDAIVSVLTDRTTALIAQYPDKISGKMRDGLKVHRRETTDAGNPVTIEKIGSRDAYFAPVEQVLYR